MTDREKLIARLNASFEMQYSKRGLLTAQHTADDLISFGVTFQKWIPVSDRLPEEDGKFLVHRLIFGGVSTMSVVGFARNGKNVHEYDLRKKKNVWYEYDSEFGYYSLDTVTHWMPLPEPPKEENK